MGRNLLYYVDIYDMIICWPNQDQWNHDNLNDSTIEFLRDIL